MDSTFCIGTEISRRFFIGGSDALIVMGNDEKDLLRLWQEKRGEIEPEDLSGELLVQLGTVTEQLNRRWYEKNTGHVISNVQQRVLQPYKPLPSTARPT
jgi:predicted phage-related endonuclease